jgi:hypothetical protein
MAYAQHFGLSRNSPLNTGGQNDSKEIEPKVNTNPGEASSIIDQNNKKVVNMTPNVSEQEAQEVRNKSDETRLQSSDHLRNTADYNPERKAYEDWKNNRPENQSLLEKVKYNLTAPANPNIKGGTIGAVSWLTGGAGLANLGSKSLKMYNKFNKIPKIHKLITATKDKKIPSVARTTGVFGLTGVLASKMASMLTSNSKSD